MTKISTQEAIAALGASAHPDERWKVECPQRNEYLPPLAELALAHAEEYDYIAQLADVVEVGVDDLHLRVRAGRGCIDTQPYWGLAAFLGTSTHSGEPSCCVGADCTGAAFRCDWAASEGLPTTCIPLE